MSFSHWLMLKRLNDSICIPSVIVILSQVCVCVFLFSDSDLSSTGDEPMHIYPIPRQAMNQSTLPDCSVCSRKPAGGLDDGGGVHNTMYIFIHINTRVYMYNYVYIYCNVHMHIVYFLYFNFTSKKSAISVNMDSWCWGHLSGANLLLLQLLEVGLTCQKWQWWLLIGCRVLIIDG